MRVIIRKIKACSQEVRYKQRILCEGICSIHKIAFYGFRFSPSLFDCEIIANLQKPLNFRSCYKVLHALSHIVRLFYNLPTPKLGIYLSLC